MEEKELKMEPKKLILQLDFKTTDETKKETKNYKIRKQSFEIIYDYKEGTIEIWKVRDELREKNEQEKILIRTCQDRRNRGITEIEMLENIEEITKMNYEEFKKKVLTSNKEFESQDELTLNAKSKGKKK